MSLFSASTKEHYILVQCPSQLDNKAAAEFTALVQPWMEKAEKLYILDFSAVQALENPFFRVLVLFYQALKNQGSYLFTINASGPILSVIHNNGLDSALSPKGNLTEALDSAGIKTSKPTIDVNFINPFVKATQTTLETQASTKVKIGKPFLKKQGDEGIKVDIAGVISLTSNAFHGSIALCFPAKVFLAIYSNLLGEKHEVITKEIEDAAGELLNIIFGQAKAELNDKAGYSIQKAIPTIVRGSQLEVHHLSPMVAVMLPFETEAGSFHLEISTQAN